MPQVRKDEVERRIREAALAAFAEHGFAGAGVAEIARRAGTAAGNVYRYFPDKGALFASVVPEPLAAGIRAGMQAWLEAARGLDELGLTGVDGEFAAAARPVAELVLGHRLEAVVLLGQGAGTAYSGFGEEVAQRLADAALRLAPRASAATGARRFTLEEICRGYVWALVRILETFPDPTQLRVALAAYDRFHTAGLRALMGTARTG